MTMTVVIFVAKLCVIAFFVTVFVWNMIDLLKKARGPISSELYFVKQMWMLISLTAIAIVLSNM